MKMALPLCVALICTSAAGAPIEVPRTLSCITYTTCWISKGCEDDDLAFGISVHDDPSLLSVTWNGRSDTVSRLYDETKFPAGELYARSIDKTPVDQLTVTPQADGFAASWAPGVPRSEERTYNATCREEWGTT